MNWHVPNIFVSNVKNGCCCIFETGPRSYICMYVYWRRKTCRSTESRFGLLTNNIQNECLIQFNTNQYRKQTETSNNSQWNGLDLIVSCANRSFPRLTIERWIAKFMTFYKWLLFELAVKYSLDVHLRLIILIYKFLCLIMRTRTFGTVGIYIKRCLRWLR